VQHGSRHLDVLFAMDLWVRREHGTVNQ
jgi:hypothetical protein